MKHQDSAADDGEATEVTSSHHDHNPEHETTHESHSYEHAESDEKPKKGRHHALLDKLKHAPKKWIALGAIVFVVLLSGLMLLTPVGYPVIGRFFTQDVQVKTIDETFKLNVTDVTIELNGAKQEFKGEGPFNFSKVKAGKHTLKVSRQYYEDYSISFTIKPLSKRSQVLSFDASLKPTGRPVLVTVANTISGEAIKDVTITLDKAVATTNEKGEATVVLPSSANEGTVEVKKDGFNTVSVVVAPVSTGTASKLTLTPSGRVYYFSKRTGKIDLYSSNLDGTDAKVELAATGNETDDASLYTSPNRRWLAFNSTRDGGRSAGDNTLLSKVFVFDTTNGKLIAADEGDATFSIAGWAENNRLVYSVSKIIPYTSETRVGDKNKVKIYNPETNEIKLVYTNKVIGPDYSKAYDSVEYLGVLESLDYSIVLLRDYIAFSYSVSSYDYNYYVPYPNKYNIVITDLEGNRKKTITKDVYMYSLIRYGTNTISYRSDNNYYEYDVNVGNEVKEDPPVSFEPLPTLSPDGKRTAWSDIRDSQNITFIGDADGKNEKQILSKQGMTFLQWYNNDYMLLLNSKDEYALYVISVNGGEPFKISNMHSYSPNYYNGY